MEPTISVSPLSNLHCDLVAGLILPIQQIEFGVPITLADQPDLLDIEAAYFLPGGHFWGAFVDTELAGTIGLLAPTSSLGVIRKMFVKSPYRGKQWGLAQQLLDTLIGQARHSGMEQLYLGTLSQMHAAHRFYEKNGFARVAKDRLPAAFPLMPVDDTFYQRSVL